MGNKDIVSGDYMADNEHFADAFNYFIYDGEKVIKPEKRQAMLSFYRDLQKTAGYIRSLRL